MTHREVPSGADPSPRVTGGPGWWRRHRRAVIAAGIALSMVAGAAALLVRQAIPQYRTVLLVDASAGGAGTGSRSHFDAVAAAVVATGQNLGGRDALSLRRFGGACGDPANTAELVSSEVDNGAAIGAAVRQIEPRGEATLLSGVLAAVDDFAQRYPFRGSRANRIIVLSGHAGDACDAAPAAVEQQIRERVDRAGLTIDFRFVGHRLPEPERDGLVQVAAAARAPSPTFTQDQTALTATLRHLTIPRSWEAAPVAVPDPTAQWPSYRDPAAGYSLRIPPTWLSRACMGNLWLGRTKEELGACAATDFFPHLARVRLADGEDPASHALSREWYSNVRTQRATAGGVAGQRHSGIVRAAELNEWRNGMLEVVYVFRTAGHTYVLSYENAPTDHAALRAFDLMVTRTVRFG